MPRRTLASIVLAAAFLPLPAARAVNTSHWVHTKESDWKDGKFENVVATNLGDLKLSRAVKTLLEQDPRVSTVHCLVEAPDGTIYAGTGPQGVLLSVKADKVETAATLQKDESIFSLAVDRDGRILVGTGGDKGRILRIDKPGADPKELLAPEGVQYIWGLAVTPDGNVYAATGPEGQLVEIKPDGSHEVILDSDENNLLSLASDGKDLLYVGTDPNGRVYRVNRKTRESFVLYDAEESEISALVLDKNGNLYAATGQADESESESDSEDMTPGAGRPEGTAGGVEIPTTPPTNPEPPKVPEPNPGEPPPIPKKEVHAPKPVQEKPGDAEEPKEPKKPAKPSLPGAGEMPDLSAIGKSVAGASSAAGAGNAIYRIDPEGFVTEVFRQNVVVLSLLVEDGGTLLVGTGGEGTVYQVNPAAEETVALAKVDPNDVMALLPTRDGRILMGLANVGGIAALASNLAPEGTYTSPVLDAKQVSRFGKIHLTGVLPEGTAFRVSTRSGNVEMPEDKGWSAWSEPAPAAQYLPVTSPSARFLQYRLTFTSDKGKQTPVLASIDVAYQLPNLAPQVHSVKIAPSEKHGENGSSAGTPAIPPNGEGNGDSASPSHEPKPGRGPQTITWEAADPNQDPTLYSLYYRLVPSGKWILIKDKLKETEYEWDTKSVGDGEYQIKVEASDAAANPVGTGKVGSRVSDAITVDNTPPVIGDLTWQRQGNGTVSLKLRVVDRGSAVANLEYAIDSSADWQAVLPSDNIFDTPDEAVAFSVTHLTPGQHQLTLRATDGHGNQGFESLLITADPPPTSQSQSGQ